MEKLNNDNGYYKCEHCNSTNVEINNDCECIIVDLLCKDCNKESTAIREDVQQDMDNDIIDDALIGLLGDISEETKQGFKNIISNFMSDLKLPFDGILEKEQQDDLFENIIDLIEKEKK